MPISPYCIRNNLYIFYFFLKHLFYPSAYAFMLIIETINKTNINLTYLFIFIPQFSNNTFTLIYLTLIFLFISGKITDLFFSDSHKKFHIQSSHLCFTYPMSKKHLLKSLKHHYTLQCNKCHHHKYQLNHYEDRYLQNMSLYVL